MSNESHQSETLGHLEASLVDVLNSEITSKDVYDTLVNTVKIEIKYHKDSQKRAENLLLLLKGNLSALYDTEVNGQWYGQKGSEPFEETLKREGYEYTPIPTTLDAYNAQNIPEV